MARGPAAVWSKLLREKVRQLLLGAVSEHPAEFSRASKVFPEPGKSDQ